MYPSLLHVRLINWHGASLSRQALSKHLSTLEEAGLVRTEWRWRNKHHCLDRKPLQQLGDVWLQPLAYPPDSKENATDEDRAHERHG